MSSKNDENTFKILIATDIHLGYQINRKQGAQYTDSFTTFEEILQYGKEYEVDFILLGGDLFHDTKPSQSVMIECMHLLRKYCIGPGEIKMELLSDPDAIFKHCRYKTVNYEDPNMNINMPVFTIHGNHDDPSFGTVGTMDMLSVTGFVNYFGKWMDLTKISIKPIIFKKGNTHIALYGLGYVNDQRLYRLIKDDNFELEQPKDIEDCFNIFVLHQNRVNHLHKDYVPENKLPPFLNLVIWGHEHECRISPEVVANMPYYIVQPGSSIATSLSEKEAIPKHVALLQVRDTQFKLKKLKLNTVRPFIFDNLLLRDLPELKEKQKRKQKADNTVIRDYVDEYIEYKLIPKATSLLTQHPKQPVQPLIRLRIFYDDENEVFDSMTLAQKYCDDVVNPLNMILFRKAEPAVKLSYKRDVSSVFFNDTEEMFQFDNDEEKWTHTVQGGIKRHFELEENRDTMTVLSIAALNESLNQYIEKADDDALSDTIKHQMKKTIEHIKQQNLWKPDQILDKIKEYRDARREQEDQERKEVNNLLNDKRRKEHVKSRKKEDNDAEEMSGHEEETGENTTTEEKGKGRGSTRGRGSRGRGSRGGRGRATATKKESATKKNSPEFSSPRSSLSTVNTINQPKQEVQATPTTRKLGTSTDLFYQQSSVNFVNTDDSDD